ncbi:MAG: hypothetical protein IMZ71_00695 [Chloroflexi bacterium]|nr:hypothetical protein [Chloroflexota bacterium]
MAAGNTGKVPAFWIYSPSITGVTSATVEITATGIALVLAGGTSAGTDTITFAAQPTLTALVTAINALVKPAGTFTWKAGILYYGSSPSANLPMTGAVACNGTANQIDVMTGTAYATDLLADRATDVIERFMGRKFKTRYYEREVYSGVSGNRLILDQYPVTRIGRVSVGRVNAFSVTNTTALNFATFEITPTKVRLNADGVVTDKTIASSATINALIAVINAVAGWSASLLETTVGTRAAFYTSLDGTTKVSELLPLAAAYCKSPNVAYAEVPNIDMTDVVLEGGSDEDRNTGMLYSPSGWNYGRESIFVDCVAGYTVIPAALEDLCLALVKLKYDAGKKDASLQSENIGGIYSYSNRDLKAVSADILDAASYFRKLVL